MVVHKSEFMNTKLLKSAFLLLVLVSLQTVAAQESMKIGYMNPQNVLDQLPEKQDVEQKLQQLAEQKRGELEQRTIEFQQRVSQFQQNQGSMTEQQIQQTEQQLQQQQQQLEQYRMSIQRQLQQRRSELLSPIFNRIDSAIQKVAKEKNLTFVLNQATSMGNKIIYYTANEQMDITDEVLAKYKEQN